MVFKKGKKERVLSYFIKTYGCQMNVNDSEYLAGQLEEMDYKKTPDLNNADLIILNTCCVRKKVEQKIYSMAGRVSQIKEDNPEVVFGICGCLAQKEIENIAKKIPYIDIIFGPSQITSFREIMELYRQNEGKETIIFCDNREPLKLANKPIKHHSPITAYIQIMKGCNNFCSYCIVPYTRGPEESRAAKEIIDEIEELASKKYKEIMLLGQNVNSYGQGLSNKDNFLNLLSQINKIEEIKRIRFTTSHPKDFNLDLIKVIKDGSKICEHIHLPLQSGSDNILNEMNRKYNMKQYYNIINNIRKCMPDASITTDIMVGFPGETEEDFQETIKACQNIQFDSCYTFIYSNRENTLSPFLGEEIPLLTKKKRLWALMEVQKEISSRINQSLIGKTVEVLVENRSKKGIENQYWGKTRTNKVAVFPYSNNDSLIAKLVYVKVKKADAYTLFGELIDVKRE